jgi:hypothetical protein
MATTPSNKNKNVILNDLKDLQDLKQLKKQARESASELREYAGKVNKLAHDFLGIANDEIHEVGERVRTRIEDEPLRAAAAAFVIGYLFRAITRR